MQLNWLTHSYDYRDGYGRMCLYFIRHLLRRGIQVTPLAQEFRRWDGWIQRLTGADYSRITISMTPGYNIQAIPGRQWAFSMYEASRIPDDWVERFNGYCERLLVPSQWCADCFAASGVSIPIHVIPGGTEPEEFPSIAFPASRPYTFLALGDRGARKGWDVAWTAFYKAFRDNPDVRLIVKSRRHNNGHIAGANVDNRISFWREDIRSLHDAFVFADCFVFPTRAEGFGMPPREAVMAGVPTICTRYSGCDDADKWCIPIEKYMMQTALIDGGGEWALADADETAEHMLWCYEHREEARARAQQGRQWLIENQTCEHSVQALLDLLEQYA